MARTTKPWTSRWDFRILIILIGTSLTSFTAFNISSRDYVDYNGDKNYIRPTTLEEQVDTYNYNQSKRVLILMWDGGTPFGWGDGEVIPLPNYGGFVYHKGKCPVQCDWTKDRNLLPAADAILFDPCLTGPTGFRDIPVYMPDKLPSQQWGWFAYEQYEYFPMMKEKDYMDHFDYKMTYHHDSQVQITFACPWAGVSDLLAPLPPKDDSKIVAVFISNCGTGGADKRLRYLEELMKHMPVDSFGACFHNKDYHYTAPSHGSKMRDKIATISEYKFLLAFENNDIEDYVTEKLINAYQAGAVPIYMGSPSIDKWKIAEHSMIKVTDYPNPKDLADYLLFLNKNNTEYMKYFEWKQTGISPTFQRLWDNCFAFAECRLCKYIARSRDAIGEYQRPPGVPESGVIGYALQLNGLDADLDGGDDYVQVPHNSKLSVSREYTLIAWIKLYLIQDGRIMDKNEAGSVLGYNFDVVAVDSQNANKAFLRLCAGGACYHAQRTLGLGLWYHVAAAVTTQGDKQSVTFYINGKEDSQHTTTSITATNSLPLRFGRATGGGLWRPHHSSTIFDGVIDEISIWDRALTQKEIFDYMFLRPYGNVENLVAWWNFNEGKGDTVHDVGPNGLHGRIFGSPTWVVSVSKPVLDPSNAEGRPH
eukprot:Phypoly_transcript_04927.p1 GENE.Phypoly_transcript_04927~~Phypoly_transcript_04927.p1  ORF type:complete len:647 (+),score=65.01 Phypoly_transcript_04927:85-2025(+)